MNSDRITEAGVKIAMVIGLVMWCYVATQYTDVGVAAHLFPATISASLARTFEHHFWQFVLGFTAIGYLSRGHLWSYGINSNNLKSSMRWLGLLYIVTIVVTFVDRLFGTSFIPMNDAVVPTDGPDTVFVILIYWMSSPVAHQILFFGLVQTVLAKKVFTGNGTASMSVVIIIASGIFAWTGTVGFGSVSADERIFLFVLGVFSGTVYWKTGSLITPMLGHAFIFGFPVVIEIIARHIAV
jgi:type IV secretory pathway VirB2 component (pilin)